MSKKKKGLSLEDKRDKILEIFHETKSVFNFKEVEKLAVKKGVVQQAIKDVLKSLVDDDLVLQEKIGIGGFYWSFPSKVVNEVKQKIAISEHRQSAGQAELGNLNAALEQAESRNQETEDRALKKRKLEELQETDRQLTAELAQYDGNSADALQGMQDGIKVAREAVNRWSDNLDAGRKYLKNKYQSDKKVLDHLFPEMDYV